MSKLNMIIEHQSTFLGKIIIVGMQDLRTMWMFSKYYYCERMICLQTPNYMPAYVRDTWLDITWFANGDN